MSLHRDLIIETERLSKSYASGWFRRKSLPALNNVDLNVIRGEVFALLGPNGAGKTTLIKLLLGILHPSNGKATVLGLTAGSQAARTRIGYLPENLVFPKHLTGCGALYFYGRLSRLSDAVIRSRLPALLELVGLTGREQESVRKYSKGMRQRLGLAQALLHEPEILILDEPTDGLDPLGRTQMRELIERLKASGKTIFLNSHILQEVELICDRVAILANGNLRAIGTIPQLVNQYAHGKLLRVHLHCRTNSTTAIEAVRNLVLENSAIEVKPIELKSSIDLDEDTSKDYSIQCETTEQRHIDKLVDLIRNQGISILKLERHRMRLEDVFVNLVESSANELNSSVTTLDKG